MDAGLGDQNCTSEGNESDNIMLLSLENQPLQTLENPQTPLISQNPQNSENPQTPQTPTPTEIPDGQPYVEMEFDSMEKARDYYEDYGKNQGKPASLRVVNPMYNEQLESFRQVEEGQEVEVLNGPSTAGVNVEELANQQQVEEPINAGNVPQVMLLDPNLSQTKGRKRDGKGKEVVASARLKSGLELSTNKRKRKCNCCGKMTRHDKRNCPDNPNAKKKNVDTCSDVEDDEEDPQG
ncbi:hypothetical protein Dimus_033568 [Dionaea muscipula]